jgi:hypothetical protein
LGVVLPSRTKIEILCCWVVGLSLSGSRLTSAGLDAASAAPHTQHSIASLGKTRAPRTKHAELCAALVTAFSPKQETSFRAPLMGFFQITPLRRHHPENPATHRSGARGANLERGPSMLFLTAPTVCSSQSFAGLLRPAADHGVRLVLSLLPTVETAVRQTLLRGADPSELFPPLRQSVVTPTLLPGSPKPLPLSSFPTTGVSEKTQPPARPQGFDPHRVRCLLVVLPQPLGPMLSWASSTRGSHPRSRGCPLCAARHRNDELPAVQAPLLTPQPSRHAACATQP